MLDNLTGFLLTATVVKKNMKNSHHVLLCCCSAVYGDGYIRRRAYHIFGAGFIIIIMYEIAKSIAASCCETHRVCIVTDCHLTCNTLHCRRWYIHYLRSTVHQCVMLLLHDYVDGSNDE